MVFHMQLRPRWHAYSSLQLRNAYTTLYYDSLRSTQSIENKVSSNAQIEQIYDTYIVTKKGSSILKMLNYTLTKEVFQAGLHNYLKKLYVHYIALKTKWIIQMF